MNSTALRVQELAEARALKAERDEARKKRAFAMFEDGYPNAHVAGAVGACAKTVACWRKEWKP